MEGKRYPEYWAPEYVAGSAARKLAPQQEEQERKRPYLVEEPERQPKPKIGRGIDFISMLFLIAAIAVTLYICIEYLQVQADVVQLNKSITTLENQISAIQKENNALEAVLSTAACDLEYIYRVAVGRLGMVYPNKNEIVYYKQEEEGYFRQYNDIPEQ